MFPQLAEVFYLKSEERDAGVHLLQRAGLSGVVFSSKSGWVSILVDGIPMRGKDALIAKNDGRLLHFVSGKGYGWWFELYDGRRLVSSYNLDYSAPERTSLEKLSIPEIAEVLHLPPESRVGLEEILIATVQARLPKSLQDMASAFATLLELPQRTAFTNQIIANERTKEQIEALGGVVVASDVKPRHMVPIPVSASDLLFPQTMFGSAMAVRGESKKLARKLWKCGKWSAALENIPLVPAFEHSDRILIGPCANWIPATETHWRPYLLTDEILAVCLKSPLGIERRASSYRKLLLSGMDMLWFTLAMLMSEHSIHFNLPCSQFDSPNVYRYYLAAYTRWLPEIVALTPWLFDITRFLSSSTVTFWSRNVLGVAHGSGWRYAEDSEYLAMAGRDAVTTLLRDQIIEKDGTRFRVCAQYRPSTTESN